MNDAVSAVGPTAIYGLAFAIFILIVLVLRTKIHPVLALVIAASISGMSAGMAPDADGKRFLAEPDGPWLLTATSVKPWFSKRLTPAVPVPLLCAVQASPTVVLRLLALLSQMTASHRLPQRWTATSQNLPTQSPSPHPTRLLILSLRQPTLHT